MLLRVVCTAVGGAGLRHQCKPLEDERILDLVEQLRRNMGIARRVRVAVSEYITVPGVVGCVWPALLLPASMMSGVPTDELRAIIAHELAHVRRYDYLVNFCQMVIEAIFFFNPAVWWISKQVRFEREACCDKTGVAATGQRVKYAEVLADWAQTLKDANVSVTAPAIGFGQADGGGMLERVRRIVVAGHRPRLKVSWYIAAITLLLSLAILIGLWRGTTMTVALAGKLLTPQQRIDKITEISKDYGFEDREYGTEDEIRVSGVVRTYDGRPLPEDTHLTLRSHRPSHGLSKGISMSDRGHFTRDGSLNSKVDYGRVFAMARCSSYAPAFAGPFEAEPGGIVEGIELVLGRGFVGRIKVIDQADQPIPNAQIIGGYLYPEGGYHHTIKLTTDSNGLAIIKHAVARRLGLQIEADGFGPERFEGIVPDPNRAVALTLKATPATSGIVVSKETAQPVEGAEVRVMLSRQGRHTYGERRIDDEPQAVTDEAGRFELTSLRTDREHLVLVTAKNYGRQYLTNFKAGDNDLRVALGPKKNIRGRVIGDLDRLSKSKRSGKPEATYWQRYGFEHEGESDSQERAEIIIKDGVGYFEIENCWGQRVNIWAGGEQVSVDVDDGPLDDVVIELKTADEEMRQVILRFQAPQGSPPVQGGVRIDYCRPGDSGMRPGWLDIEDGRAQCEIPTPGRFKYGIDYHQGMRPVGYWFERVKAVDVPAGDEPFIIDVPVHPAGAIYGRVFRADDSPARNVSMSLIVANKPETLKSSHDLSAAPQSKSPDRSRFNASPLPLNGQYVIVVRDRNFLSATEPILINEANPIRERNIRFGRGVTLSGRLLDVDGGPAVTAVALEVSLKCGDTSWGTDCRQVTPDPDGTFAFASVNPDFTGEYYIRAIVAPGYRPVRKEVKDLHRPITIQLEKGLRATGIVIDKKTGWPVPGVKVSAYFVGTVGGKVQSEFLDAEGRTNNKGEFVFSNMAKRSYKLTVSDVRLAEGWGSIQLMGGRKEPVIVYVTIPERSDLKPRKPLDRND
jgi:hypothetical protein